MPCSTCRLFQSTSSCLRLKTLAKKKFSFLQGHDMQRLDHNSKIGCEPFLADQFAEQHRHTAAWQRYSKHAFSPLSRPSGSRAPFLRPKFRSSEPEWPRNHLEDLGFLHIQLHQWQSDWAGALAVTVEDKDPSILWAHTQRGVLSAGSTCCSHNLGGSLST